MAKPTDSELFATDATYALDGDSWSGDPVRVDPGAARRAEGFEPDLLPAEWANHVLGVHGDHLDYLNGIVEADGTETIPTVSRSIVLGAIDMRMAGISSMGWSMTGLLELWSYTNSSYAMANLRSYLPHSGTLTRIEALVTPGSSRTGTNRVSIQVDKKTPNFSIPGFTSSALVSPVYDDGTALIQTIDSGALAVSISSLVELVLGIKAGHDAVTNRDVLHAVQITFTDPGPRNF